MTRLPIPGGDDGQWGSILNDFLDVSFNSDGTLKPTAVTATNLTTPLPVSQGGTGSATQNFVDVTTAQTVGGTKTFTSAPIVPTNSFPETAVANLTADLGSKVSASIVTTKGDLLAATGSAALARLGAGTNGQILTADSAQSTGLKWSTSAAISVKDYGATGDGTTDDTAAIQNAITAAKASTQRLFFPPGNYLISSTLNVGGGFPGGLYVFGTGWDSQISLATHANCYIFSLGNVYTPGLVIRDLFLSCNGGNQTSDSGGIDAYGAVNCLFENLQIDTPFYDGIYLHNDGTGGFGHDNTISNCLFVNGKNTGTGLGQALEIFEADENYIVNCTFGDNGNPNFTYPYHNGAQPGGTVYQVFESAGLNHFVCNSFVNGGQGVTILRANGSRNTFTNNIFDGGSGNQLHINGYASTIQGNIFANIGSNAGSGSPKAGVYLDGKSRIMVANNVFSPINSGQGYATAGVWTDFGADNNDIVNNEFSLDGVTGTWQYGAAIRLNTGGGHNNVSGNNGFTTLAVGTATITTTQSAIVVSHGLALSPTAVTVTPQGNPGSLTWWVSGTSSSQFTINVSANPGSNLSFYWRAEVLAG